MALALHTGTPIHVTEEVLEQAGIDIPVGMKDGAIRANGVRSILEGYQQAIASSSRPKDTEAEKDQDSETAARNLIRKSQKELIEALFGE